MRKMIASLVLACACVLAGCGAGGTTQQLTEKSRGCQTREALQKALGKPQKVKAVNMPGIVSAETWTYQASDGEVTFQLLNDKVVLQMTGEGDKK